MRRIVLILLSLFSILVIQAQIMPSDARIVKILNFSFVGEDGSLGFDGDEDFSPEEMQGFFAWFRHSENPLLKINQFVTDPSLRAKAITVSATSLEDEKFYDLAVSVLERFGAGEASEAELRSVLMPPEGKRGLLEVMFKDGRLQSALSRCIAVYPKEGSLNELLNFIASGDGAKSVLKGAGNGYLERYGPLAKQALEGKVPSLSTLPNSQFRADKTQVKKTASEEASKVGTATAGRMFPQWLWVALAFTVLFLILLSLRRKV